jgi:hypothetical protein
MLTIVKTGSAALHRRIPSVKIGEDIDYIMSFEDFEKFVGNLTNVKACYPINRGKTYVVKTNICIYEVEIAWPGSTAEEFLRLVTTDAFSDSYSIGDTTYWIPSIQALHAMKMSHRFKKNSVHFLKTMQHIKLMRKQWADYKYGTIGQAYSAWFARREKETYDYSHPDLTVKKNDFFKDETFYRYDHDDIHESIKLTPTAAYKYILADGYQVKCDKDKFFALTEDQKYNCVLEESYTLALERSQIPFNFRVDARESFEKALMKVCTSITSGWFREWAWEHHDEVLAKYNGNYVDKFDVALRIGKVRPFTHDRVAV